MYVTDRRALGHTESERHERLLASLRHACDSGVDLIQLREKDMPAQELARLAREVLAVMREYAHRPKLLINGRADVALAVGADGFHLSSAQDALGAAEMRALWHRSSRQQPFLSVSCHSIEEVRRANSEGADVALFGPVFEKNGELALNGLERLREVCAQQLNIPVIAIGGIDEMNARSCMEVGAAGIAAIRMFQVQRSKG